MITEFKIGDKVRLKDGEERREIFPNVYEISKIRRGARDMLNTLTLNGKLVTELFSFRLELVKPNNIESDPEYSDLFI